MKEWFIPKIDFKLYYDVAGKYKKPGPTKQRVVSGEEYDKLVVELNEAKHRLKWSAGEREKLQKQLFAKRMPEYEELLKYKLGAK